MTDPGWMVKFEAEPEWGAYHKAEQMLLDLGYSIGPMQRGEPTAALYGDWQISKWRGLTKRDRDEVHAKIIATGPSFRGSGVVVIFTERAPVLPKQKGGQ